MVKIGATPLAGVGSWEINASGEIAETTGMDSAGIRGILAGVTSWGGSIEVTFDDASTPYTILPPGKSFTGTFYSHSASLINFCGQCIVSGYRHRVDITDKITYAVDFEGNGALSQTGL